MTQAVPQDVFEALAGLVGIYLSSVDEHGNGILTAEEWQTLTEPVDPLLRQLHSAGADVAEQAHAVVIHQLLLALSRVTGTSVDQWWGYVVMDLTGRPV